MIPFTKPAAVGREAEYLGAVLAQSQWAGPGRFVRQCESHIAGVVGRDTILTHSCTAALEMAAVLADIAPGDEVIVPSFTFAASANAVVARGATPIFVDIRPDTLNIDAEKAREGITSRTRAIIAVHYAGVCADMDAINALAVNANLVVIEDAAQAFLSTYKGRPAGSLGDAAAFSFHHTKNVISGQGGALMTGHADLFRRAQVLRDQGTSRQAFIERRLPYYEWVDFGSAYGANEFTAAVLCAQLEHAEETTRIRRRIWSAYQEAFLPLERQGRLRCPQVPADCVSNAHIWFLLLDDGKDRDSFMKHMAGHKIETTFHYVPLHSAPAAARLARTSGHLDVTEDIAARLVRFPLYPEMESEIPRIVDAAYAYLHAGAADRRSAS